MKWYNFHRVHPDQLEAVVNAHIRRGYDLHTVYRSSSRADVSFVRDLPEAEWGAKFETSQARATAAQQARDGKAEQDRLAAEARKAAKPEPAAKKKTK